MKFNADALVRSDMSTRYASYQIGRQIGMLSIDEIRALEDKPPLPNGEGQDYAPLKSVAPPQLGNSVELVRAGRVRVGERRAVRAFAGVGEGRHGATALSAYLTTQDGGSKLLDVRPSAPIDDRADH